MPNQPPTSSLKQIPQNTGIDDRMMQVNQRLKIAQMGFQIERRGQKLSLRGILPPRPGSPSCDRTNSASALMFRLPPLG